MASTKGSIVIDPDDDFEGLLISIINLQRKKRKDYANQDDLVANLRRTASMLDLPGYTPFEDAMGMVARKYSRLINLRGHEPTNEALVDTIDDLIVYALFAKYLLLEDLGS